MKMRFAFVPVFTAAKTLLPSIVVLLVSLSVNAQRNPITMYVRNTSSLSLQAGGNSFLGDLGGNKGTGRPFAKDLNLKTTRLFTGLSYSYFVDNGLSINADFHFTSVKGADSVITNRIGHAAGRYERNLSFKSSVYEFQTTVEIYPFQLIDEDNIIKWMPYIGTGAGIFHFDPKAQLNGTWYKLRPLHLEGEGFAEFPERGNYKLTQLYIPLTVGLRYRINNSYLLSLNAIFRKTFTDYIDDVSTTYIDPALFDKYLSPNDASIAKQLYYRGRSGVTPPVGSTRGYSGNDSYTSVFFSFTYLFNQNSLPSFHDRPGE